MNNLQDVGTRYRFRYVDGKMFSELVPADYVEPDEPKQLVEVGTRVLFVKVLDSFQTLTIKPATA